ncbi:MAG TPA: ABC transporter substrate-binding protein [Candidatus Kapabacteria bacterium]|nr:ABC transporter substrate-binding protein [Candidatus Kapabacteria bacterium]
MKKTYLPIAAALVIALAMTLSSCGKKSGEPHNNFGLSTKNQVVWWQLADATNIIPPLSQDATSSYVYQLIWEGLNGQNPRTNDLIAGVASLPEISPDHLTYTYTINPKAKFSDGHPLTGDDVIFSYKDVMNPLNAETTQKRNYIQNVDSVTFVGGDKMKVAFHLNKLYYKMNEILGGAYVTILPKHIFDPNNVTDKISWGDLKNPKSDNPALKDEVAFMTDASHFRDPKFLIGSGAYMFKEWVTGSHITLRRDTNYWAKDNPWGEAYPDEIVFKTINDFNAALTALKAKDIDLMDGLSGALFDQIDTNKQPYIHKDTVYYNSRVYIEWNEENPLFQDKRVRWALGHLVNRDEIIKQVSKGLARPINSVINFTQPNYDPSIPGVDFNPDKAKQLLAEAGWTDSDGDGVLDKVIDGKKVPFKFTFMNVSGNKPAEQMLLIISEQLRKVGIQADVSSFEWSVWINNRRNHQYDASISNFVGNATEDDEYQLLHSSQAKNKGSNVFSFINPEADKIMEAIRVEFDKAKRLELSKQLQKIVYDEQPLTMLWSSPLRIGVLRRFDNVEWFTQRPCYTVTTWIVRGSGVMPKANAPSTYANTW